MQWILNLLTLEIVKHPILTVYYYLSEKINSKKSGNIVALSNLSIYYNWKYIKKTYKSNKFKISASTCNEDCELPAGSYSVSDIQDYFECTIKKHDAVTGNPSIMIYVENRITFKINAGHYLEFLMPEQ